MPPPNALQIPFLPGYPRPDRARENFHKQQMCAIKQGASFVQRSSGTPIVSSAASSAGSPAGAGAPAPAVDERRVDSPATAPYVPSRPQIAPPARDQLGVPAGWTAAEASHARALGVESLLPEPPRWAREAHEATLSFNGYFRETVDSGEPGAHERVRFITLTYHVGDGTALIYERPKENAGMPQGVLLKRHRIRAPSGGYYGLADLNVGAVLDCYGRHVVLTSTDAFTRAFLSARGVQVLPDGPLPPDPSAGLAWPPGHPSERDEPDEITPPRAAGGALAEPTALQRFLEFDRVVLRYYLVWDEGPPISRKRQLELRFFLADGTAEVQEDRGSLLKARLGSDVLPFVVRRTKIPLKYEHASAAAFGGGAPTKLEVLSPDHLTIGAVVDIFGRKCVVHDADGATRSWAAQRGLPLLPPITASVLADAKPKPVRALPPHTGFGSKEDSLSSVRGGLVPRAQPRRDLFRRPLAEPGSVDVGTHSTAGRALRFGATIAAASDDDASRRFVVSFFLEDGTLSVFEVRAPNSGHIGGLFLERSRVPLPRGHGGTLLAEAADEATASGTAAVGSGYYEAHHLSAGETVDLFGRRLVLTDADAFTERYLSAHASDLAEWRKAEAAAAAAAAALEQSAAAEAEAAKADDAAARAGHGAAAVETQRVDRLEKQLRSVLLARSAQIRTVFRRIDRNADGRITLSEFATLLSDLHFELDAEEVAALMRRFDKGNDGYISFDSFCETVIPKDFTFAGAGYGSGSALARPSTAPAARHEVGTGELLRAYARAEVDAADGKAVEGLLARLRSVFADRGSRLAVIFREMDTTRSGSLGPAEFRAALDRHSIRVSDKEFALLMRTLKKHSERKDDRVEFAAFGAMLGRQ